MEHDHSSLRKKKFYSLVSNLKTKNKENSIPLQTLPKESRDSERPRKDRFFQLLKNMKNPEKENESDVCLEVIDSDEFPPENKIKLLKTAKKLPNHLKNNSHPTKLEEDYQTFGMKQNRDYQNKVASIKSKYNQIIFSDDLITENSTNYQNIVECFDNESVNENIKNIDIPIKKENINENVFSLGKPIINNTNDKFNEHIFEKKLNNDINFEENDEDIIPIDEDQTKNFELDSGFDMLLNDRNKINKKNNIEKFKDYEIKSTQTSPKKCENCQKLIQEIQNKENEERELKIKKKHENKEIQTIKKEKKEIKSIEKQSDWKEIQTEEFLCMNCEFLTEKVKEKEAEVQESFIYVLTPFFETVSNFLSLFELKSDEKNENENENLTLEHKLNQWTLQFNEIILNSKKDLSEKLKNNNKDSLILLNSNEKEIILKKLHNYLVLQKMLEEQENQTKDTTSEIALILKQIDNLNQD